MSTPRRDNGLFATSYDRLVDVETHLVEGLLERLRDEQVAAYSAPAAGRRGAYGEVTLPSVPSDSVYVDASRRVDARAVVDRYLAEVADEVTWAGIVADFHREPGDALRSWPASEDVPEDEPSSTGPPERAREDRPRQRRAHDADEEHFEPPPPPPLPSVDPITRFAWAGTLGAPFLLLLAAVIGLSLPGWVGFLALVAFMAGFVTLVARMKDRPPTDSGPDDGAVV